MPILFSIEGADHSSAAFTKAKASVTELGAAFDKANAQAAAFQATLDRANALAASFAAAVDRTTGAYGRMADSLARVDGMSAGIKGSFDAQVAGFGRVASSADLATAAIGRQVDALGRLALAGRAGTVSNTLASDVQRAESSRFGNAGRVLAGGAAGDVGLLGRAGAMVLGPEGLFAGALAYGGFKASQAATAFQSATAQTGAQIGNPAVANATAQQVLAYTSSGKSPYDATTLIRSIEPLLAHGYSQSTINAGIAPLSQLSAQNKAADLGTSVNAVNTYLAIMGNGAKSTASQMVDAVNYLSKIEKLTTIPPGDISRTLPNLLTATLGTGITPEQMGGAFLKIGTANPSAQQDTTTLGRLIQEMLVKNTPGAMKEASSLGLAMGPGSLNAYGGSFEAMVQAYANATAGPNQARDLSLLFPTSGVRGGSTAFKELISGSGTQTAVGYEGQLGNRSGSASSAYADYSAGIPQQETQLASQFNSEMVRLGSTINQTVVPALLLMASSSLNAVNDSANAGSWVAGAFKDVASALHMPGGAGTLAAGLLPAGLGSYTAIMKGLYDHGGSQFLGQVGNQAQQQGGNDVGNQGRVPGYPTAGLIAQSDNPYSRNIFHPITPPIEPFTPGTPQNEFVRHLGSLKGGTGFQGNYGADLVSGIDKVLPAIVALGPAFSSLGTIVDTARTGLRASLGPPSNAPLNADRAQLSNMISSGANSAHLYTQLAKVHGDLQNSTYTSSQQHSIYAAQSQRVYAAATGPGDQNAIAAAQMMLNAAQQMNLPPAVIKRDQDSYLAVLTKLYTDTETGTKRAADLRSVAVQRQTYGYQDNSTAIDRHLKDLQNQSAIDQARGNTGALGKDNAAILGYQTKNAQYFKLDPSDLAALQAQNQAALLAQNTVVNQHQFFAKNPGLGSLEAGSGASVVRAGGIDPSVNEVRLMRQEITTLREENANYLAQLVRNTTPRGSSTGNNPGHGGMHS